MSRLTKTVAITYIPADPGVPAFPGTPPTITLGGAACTGGSAPGINSNGQPRVIAFSSQTSGSYSSSTWDWIESIGGIGGGTAEQGIPEGKCGPIGIMTAPIIDANGKFTGYAQYTQYACVSAVQKSTQCVTYTIPEEDRLPATPAIPPTPAQTLKNFQAGWNASAQSIQGLLPGKAVEFSIGYGARGILVGFNYEAWVPNITNMPIGIMFTDGKADVYENGVFRENIGNFFRGETFLIGRSKDNKIVYMNKTSGLTQLRLVNIAPPSIPVHVFAISYYGGDTVY